jgi:hypothetical protein
MPYGKVTPGSIHHTVAFQKSIRSYHYRVMHGYFNTINSRRKVGTRKANDRGTGEFNLRTGKMHFYYRCPQVFAQQGVTQLSRKAIHRAINVYAQVLRAPPATILDGIKYAWFNYSQTHLR